MQQINKVKKKITMLNLYRCSSEKEKMTTTGIGYFSMDYFDGIKIENINVKEGDMIPTLGICMGIKADANSKQGISHQRYCLAREQDDDFEVGFKYPLLTIMQVFINPNLYQAKEFAGIYSEEDAKKITCRNCMRRVKKHIEERIPFDKNIKFGVYRLVTEGDFAVLVWSNTVHDAYDVTTLVRNISILYDDINGSKSSENALFSYSITGVWNHKQTNMQERKIDWTAYLDEKDRVDVRFEYSPKFRATGAQIDTELIKSFLEKGQRLLGRYDHQILLNRKQFQELYPYITDYKLGKNMNEWKEIARPEDPLVEVIVSMMQKEYISYINEKLLLGYSEDHYFDKESSAVWKIITEGKWQTLYNKNAEMIQEGKKRWREVEENLADYYQSCRNMQEYVRLIGRFYRVLNEMNQLMELRVSTANLLKQMDVMLDSLIAYLKYAKMNNWNRRITADCIGQYLQQGIYAVEIFMRYVRNINLQTLQTPNYDLQTNVCIEKVLLAYSQMLRPLTEKRMDKEAGLFLGSTLYPIVVPSMANKDLTVGVLFDSSESDNKLMVVSTPTFLFMCDTCFMVPAVFHEIGHQYRYEARGKRNRCLVRTIYKNLIVGILQRLISLEYSLQDEKEFEVLFNDMCDYMEQKLGLETKSQFDLKAMEMYMISVIEKLVESEKENQNIKSLEENVEDYIEKTKEDVREFDKKILKILKVITSKLESYGEIKKKIQKNIKEELRTGNHCEDIESTQQIEILYWEIMKVLEKYYLCQVQQINTQCPELREIRWWITNKNEDWIIELEKLRKSNPENTVLKENVQAAVNIKTRYEDYKKRGIRFHEEWNESYEDLLIDISETAYEKFRDFLEKYQKNQKEQVVKGVIGITESEIEYARKRISLEKEKLIRTTIYEYFKEFSSEKLTELVSATINQYREITADLFMCAAMKFTVWGYLIFIAETYEFKANIAIELYQRIFAVVQCLITKEMGHAPSDDEYNDYVEKMVKKEIKVLFENLQKEKIVKESIEIYNIEDALSCLENIKQDVKKTSALTATQKWIFRVYHQAATIAYNVYDIRVASEIPLQSDIWEDISSEESYLNKENEINELIDKTKIRPLSQAIAQILNSPVKYFDHRKELLDEEIDFVFDNYEENCRNVFR